MSVIICRTDFYFERHNSKILIDIIGLFLINLCKVACLVLLSNSSYAFTNIFASILPSTTPAKQNVILKTTLAIAKIVFPF